MFGAILEVSEKGLLGNFLSLTQILNKIGGLFFCVI